MLDLWSQSVVAPGQSSPLEMPLNLSLENPRVSLADPEAYDDLTDGIESGSGVAVSRARALAIPAVWQAIDQISGDVAKLPIDLFKKNKETDDRQEALEHPVFKLVRRKPNREMDAYKFWRRVMVHRLFWDNAYVYISRRLNGTIHELIPMLPDRTEAVRVDGQLFYDTEVNGTVYRLFPEQVWHIEGICCDGLTALNMMRFAREAFGLALARQKCSAKFFQNGMRTGGILEISSAVAKGTADKIEQGFRKSYESVEEAFKTVILREGAKFHMAQLSPEQTQMTESSRDSVRDAARYFNTRPSRLGEEAKASFASKSEDNRDYLDTTLSPHLASIIAQSNDKLLTEEELAAGYYLEYNLAALLQMDFKSVCESLSVLRSAEILSPNECRAVINYNRRDDAGGDKFGNPNTTSNKGSDNAAAVAAAHRKLLANTLDRMVAMVDGKASRNSSLPNNLIEWVSAKLPGLQKTVRAAVTPVIEAHAAVAGVDAEPLVAKATSSFMLQMRVTLLQLANTVPAGALKATVNQTLADVSCESIAEEVIPMGEPNGE
ncbi:phage portal protein [Lacipirellula sp.]|uniref:phage portal protein n=1 Tax=Lacipirellula sp. TaxID=2691419 RepID=UPI003D0F2136